LSLCAKDSVYDDTIEEMFYQNWVSQCLIEAKEAKLMDHFISPHTKVCGIYEPYGMEKSSWIFCAKFFLFHTFLNHPFIQHFCWFWLITQVDLFLNSCCFLFNTILV
jgi:hypothetical protein